MYKNAAETFEMEMYKRDIAIKDMSKKLMVINYANEFIENKLNSKNASVEYNKKLAVFDREAYGSFESYGYTVHPKFKKPPIDIFNLKLVSGDTMFKNSLSCTVNEQELSEEEEKEYINILVSDNSIEKAIFFKEYQFSNDEEEGKLKITYTLDNETSLGTMRFNVIEIDPYIYGTFDLQHVEIFTLSENQGIISETPERTISDMNDLGKIRIILDKKFKFSKVVFHFKLKFKTKINNQDVYPFGLKHIHFYEADFITDSHVIVPIRANDYIEYIYNNIKLYHAGVPIDTTCDFYNIEIYSDFINNTLTGRVYPSSDAQAYRIAKNTKVLYAKVPLIWTNQANTDKQYLSLSGILFDYTVDENTFI
jgi:hypothetical protein